MNILLKFNDNSRLQVPFTIRQKIKSLTNHIFKKYPNYVNEDAISFKYQDFDQKTNKFKNIKLDKNKTFQKYKIKTNTIIYVEIDLDTIYSPPKIEAKVDKLISSTNNNININANSKQQIYNNLKELGFDQMDEETIYALIDTCKAKKDNNNVSIEDILEYLTSD